MGVEQFFRSCGFHPRGPTSTQTFPDAPSFVLGAHHNPHPQRTISNSNTVGLATPGASYLALPLGRSKPFFPGLAARRNVLGRKKAM